MIRNEKVTVVSQIEIAASIFKLTLRGALVSEMIDPGQFVHVKVTEGEVPLLRRPISISSIDREDQQFTMIYRAEGQGTKQLSARKKGDRVDVLGPLGHGFPVEEANAGETALLIGGGIGVPPLYELSRQLIEKGVNVIHVLGFQNEGAVFYQEEFASLGETYIATVDGSHGEKGFVTDVIAQFGLEADIYYSCGPTSMLRAIQTIFHDKKVYLSLEERMGCGIGACFACVCHIQDDPTGYSYKKVCSDGPVFRAGEVVI